MESVFLENWSSIDDVASSFSDEDVRNFEIVVAWYGYGPYSGDAYVLAGRNGSLYECAAGHCSCYGLEGQWRPVEVTRDYLRNRLEHGAFEPDVRVAIAQFLGE